jgi:pyruvate ferredoxin oxidoreductase alpha subunit
MPITVEGKRMVRLFLSGSESAAHGVRLARVPVISAYPISPNVNIIATLAEMVSEGELDAEFINVEGEHSAASVISGASAAGSRAFTASCGFGLAYMHEVLWMASGMALPIVVAVASRALGKTLECDLSDMSAERDASFLHFYAENAQEVVDSIIMAYRVSEHPEVLLPSLVCLEGYRLTHTYEPVDIPGQDAVDRFLPPYRPKHAFLDPKYPIMLGSTSVPYYSQFKYAQHEALLRAKDVLKDTFREFDDIFGRSYDLVEAYKADDADMVIVALGSMAGVIRETVDEYRNRGVKLGMLKIRMFRPFPEEDIRRALKGVGKILVVDRFNSPGAHGVAYTELRSALYREDSLISSLIIGSAELYHEDVRKIVDMALDRNEEFEEWYIRDIPDAEIDASGWDNYQALCRGETVEREDLKDIRSSIAPGTSACQGCAPLLAMRNVVDAMGEDAVCIYATGCMQAVSSRFPRVGWNMASVHFCFTNVASAASGVEAAFRQKGKETSVLVFGGDGALSDIGLQPLSGAIERGHDITYVCYDNEAYMNTGVQRSGTTTFSARTKTTPRGKEMQRKDLTKIMEAHGIYVATALPCFPGDLVNKVQKGKSIKGPAFIHVLCPCPVGWEFDPSISVKLSRLAFETGAWVLYEYEDGVRTVSRLPKRRAPIKEYIKPQGRFSHLSPDQIAEMQKEVDKRFQALTSSRPDGLQRLIDKPG